MPAVVMAILTAVPTACTTARHAPAVVTHDVYHRVVDTITRTDSVIDRQTTVIRVADSAALAQYGIQMSRMQQAWIVETRRLQRELTQMSTATHDTVHVRDSVPYPVEVVREVPVRQPADAMTAAGTLSLMALLVMAFRWAYRRVRQR